MADDKRLDIRKAIHDHSKVSDLSNLVSSGVTKVKVLDENALHEMIEAAVNQVISTQTSADRAKILADSRRQLTQIMNERDQANSLAAAGRNELIQKIESLQKEITLRQQVAEADPALQLKLDELGSENTFLREGNDKMVEEIDQLRTENKALKEEIARLQAELELLRSATPNTEELREELEMQRSRGSGLEQQLAPLQQELETLRQELEDSRGAGTTAVGGVRRELDRAREEAARLENELKTARRLDVSRSTAEEDLRREVERLRSKSTELEEEIRDLNESSKAKIMEARGEVLKLREEATHAVTPAPPPEPEPADALEEVPVPTPVPLMELPDAAELVAPEPVAASPPPAPPPLPAGVKPGKGLDVGTVNLVSACQAAGEGDIEIRQQRNVFIDVEITSYTKAMLTRLNVPYVVQAKRMYVLGEPAFQLANVLNRRTRRPMKDGLISPKEQDALPVMKMLISSILGEPRTPQEVCFYSVPGDPVDSDLSVAYHRDLFDAVLKSLGYKPSHILEGHAVTFAELGEEDFTGIGISCGGGMFNVCVAYKSMPALSFSTARSGDWVDLNVAQVLGIKPEKAAQIKELGVDLMNPKNREEDAVAIYYRNLIQYNVSNIAERFRSAENMPAFNDPVSIVFSGGTAKAGNFIELVKDVFKKVDFPIPVKEIRLAKDALNATAKGALVAAQLEMAARA